MVLTLTGVYICICKEWDYSVITNNNKVYLQINIVHGAAWQLVLGQGTAGSKYKFNVFIANWPTGLSIIITWECKLLYYLFIN